MADFGNAAMQGFQLGYQSQGPSAMGTFVTNLMDRMTKMQQVRAEAQAKVAYDPEAQAKQEAYQYVNQSSQVPEERMAMFQKTGLLKAPVDEEDIERRAFLRAKGTTEGMQGREAERQRQKQITEMRQHLRNLDVSTRGINSLFDKATTAVPPITGDAAIPGMLPIAGLFRKIGMSVGTSETARGFINTYPVEARKQLQTLEKGGRYTNQDVEQIIKAATPDFSESDVARTSKRTELLRKFQEEKETVLQQLQQLQQDDGNDELDVDFIQQLQAQGFTIEALP